MRPPSIVRFEQIYGLNILVSLASSAWMFASGNAPALPADAPAGVVTMLPSLIVGSMLVGLAISLTILYFVARRGSNVARWVFVALVALAAISLIRRAFSHQVVMTPAVGALALLQLLLQAIGLILLFRPDARAWFKG